MLKNTHEKFAEPWKEFAKRWQAIGSPGRPLLSEVKIYEKFGKNLLKKKSVKVLILGATPEIRDMLAKYKNAEVVLVDINLEMILAMTSLMKRKNPKEIWIRSDWLKAPIEENYFDLIYGDCVLGNLPPELHREFLFKLSRLLKKGGYFISRCETIRPSHRLFRYGVSMEEFCEFFNKMPLNLNTVRSFWDAGTIGLGQTKNGHLIVRKFWQKLNRCLNKYSNKYSRVAKLLKLGGTFYPLDKIWFFYKEKNLKKLFAKNFQILKEEFYPHVNFIYKDCIPIYLLMKK